MSDAIGEIVVGYDGSDRAGAALELARRIASSGATVTVVTAYRVPPEIKYYEFFEDLRAGFKRTAEETLEFARPVFEDADLDVRYEAREGRAPEAVADAARERGADLIVMGSRGLGRVRAAIGTSVLDLLNDAPCPVVVVPYGEAGDEAEASPAS